MCERAISLQMFEYCLEALIDCVTAELALAFCVSHSLPFSRTALFMTRSEIYVHLITFWLLILLAPRVTHVKHDCVI